MLAASDKAEKFRCPGEEHDISRSVHLARAAAFYSKCRHCPQAPAGDGSPTVAVSNCEISIGPPRESPPGQSPPGQSQRSHTSLFKTEGVRGRYLNELTRALAAEIAGAMASCRWDETASSVPAGSCDPCPAVEIAGHDELSTTEDFRILKPERPGPCVVVAHDERPSSPDIVTGVGQALRRMGCQVIDIGLATRPCLMFAINHFEAAGGIQVTGAGCDPGMTGLDFVSQGGIPCSAAGELDRIAERFRQGFSRPSRRPGSQRSFQASIPYEAGLWKHFHALRPLKIALASPNQAVREVFNRIFHKVACRLLPVETPTRIRKPGDPADPDLARVSRTIGQVQADLGVLIEDDGEQCTILDEQGQIIAPQPMAAILGDVARSDLDSESVVVYPIAWQRGRTVPVSDRAISGGLRYRQSSTHYVSDANRENLTRAMRAQQAFFGADGLGRYWFAESFPACDAILTVVHLLQALSQSDEILSRVVDNVRH